VLYFWTWKNPIKLVQTAGNALALFGAYILASQITLLQGTKVIETFAEIAMSVRKKSVTIAITKSVLVVAVYP